MLDTPFDANKATEDNLDALASARLDPSLARQQQSLEQSLANKGIKMGSDAYETAQTLQNQSANDARNQLFLTGHGQAFNEALQSRAQPLNELLALGGQSQVQTPQFAQTPQTGIQGTDTAGIQQTGYQNQLDQSNAFYNAAGKIGSTVGGWMFGASDERLKEDIHDTGMKTPDGIPMKTFSYKGSPMLNLGVMAQDAEKKRPDAVHTMANGYKGVEYSKIGSPMLNLGRKAA